MRRQVNSRVVLHELTHTVKCLTSCGQVLEHYRQLVSVKCCVNIRNISVHHVVHAVSFSNDYAVALSVAACLDEVDPVSDLLALREIVVRAVRVSCADDVITCELECVSVFRADVNFRVRECSE